MSVFKCKMCGGTVEFEPGATVGVCDSCGTKQTLPRLDDDRKANLYDRANHFRRNNDFDKAMGIYEQILNEDNTDAEAYWSLVLCRYGIEYVEDPATHKRVPTVNRAQYTSIFADEDYKSALQYADGYQKEIYEQEAKAIDDIQKGILEISSKEKPFDVFICYKETDAQGRRTQDSVLANDLYHQLTQEGFKVFFSRITLEDKLGTAYEPYIFAALNSAKVMVVLGTKPEYFNAVWVKNEWSRYLSIVKQSGGKKVLIPAYRDMDPYDLPEEFSHLQAQDMSKLGFMQDLIRGIKKILNANTEKPAAKETVVVNTASSSTAPLLRRAFMFLEDGNWQEADEYCEKVLDLDPECAEAYLGKLMAEMQVRKREDLADCPLPFDDHGDYQKVLRFSDNKLKEELTGYIDHINERNENERLITIYNEATDIMNRALLEADFRIASAKFKSIPGYKDADELAVICDDKAALAFKAELYNSALNRMKSKTIDGYKQAIKYFEQIPGWKDSEAQIAICENEIEDLKAKAKALDEARKRREEENRIQDAKRRKRIIVISTSAAAVCLVVLIILNVIVFPLQKLNECVALYTEGQSSEAETVWSEIENFGIVKSQLHNKIEGLLEQEQYDTAYTLLNEIGDEETIKENKYERAEKAEKSGDYELAYTLLSNLMYKDSEEKAQNIKPLYEQYLFEKAEVGDKIVFGAYEQDNDTSDGKEDIEWLVLAKEDNRILVLSDKALDCQPYNTAAISITWENGSLRKWMNSTFLDDAFSAEEQTRIQITNISADENPNYNTNSGNPTTDKIFLLSINEVKEYFDSDRARQCAPTEYAMANKVQGTSECAWWLRSSGSSQRQAALIYGSGSIHYYGITVEANFIGIRPAMWIDISDMEG